MMLNLRLLPSEPFVPVYTRIDIKRCTIKIKDGGANFINVKIGEGNITYSETVNREYLLDRGQLDQVRDGDEVPVDFTMEASWEYIRGSGTTDATPSIEDALKKLGPAAAWVSSDTAQPCNPYAVDIEIIYAPTPVFCGDMETILFSDFRYERCDHDLKAGTISINGKCNITKPTITRGTNSTDAGL